MRKRCVVRSPPNNASSHVQTAVLTVPALRRQLAKFERIVTKNAEQRGKYPDDPSKSALKSLCSGIALT